MDKEPTSEFQELREEARATVKEAKFKKHTQDRRWGIWTVLALHLIPLTLLYRETDEIVIVGIWFLSILWTLLISGILGFALSFIGDSQDLNRKQRSLKLFQLLVLGFLILFPSILLMMYFGLDSIESFF